MLCPWNITACSSHRATLPRRKRTKNLQDKEMKSTILALGRNPTAVWRHKIVGAYGAYITFESARVLYVSRRLRETF